MVETNTIAPAEAFSLQELNALFPAHESRESFEPGRDRFRELHLYHGNHCNRTCDFCTVVGAPEGWHEPFTKPVLDAALQWVALDGNLKIYGGEPTLDLHNLIEAVRYLRASGFEGWFTLFSNGVQAERVIAFLEEDARTEVVLNYSILYGDGAEPLPAAALTQLADFARRHPGRLFRSHSDMVPVGRQATAASNGQVPFDGHCPRCHPVLTSRGQLHACPFAVEEDREHYHLGSQGMPTNVVLSAYERFRRWIELELEPSALKNGRAPCTECVLASGPREEIIPLDVLV